MNAYDVMECLYGLPRDSAQSPQDAATYEKMMRARAEIDARAALLERQRRRAEGFGLVFSGRYQDGQPVFLRPSTQGPM